MINKIDAGPIYCKKIISLSGNLDNIFKKIAPTIEHLIKVIIIKKLNPKKQKGKILSYKKGDVIRYDELSLNKKYKLIDLIKINNARSFNNKTFNFFIDNGEKYEFKINVKKL